MSLRVLNGANETFSLLIACFCFQGTESHWGCSLVGAGPRHLKVKGRVVLGRRRLSIVQLRHRFSQHMGRVWCGYVCRCCPRANQSSTPCCVCQPQRTCSCWAKGLAAVVPRSPRTETTLKAELNAGRRPPRKLPHPLCPLRPRAKIQTFPLPLNPTPPHLKTPNHPPSPPRTSSSGCGRILCRVSPLTAPGWL